MMETKQIKVLMIACRYETGGAPRSMMEMINRLSTDYRVKFTIALGQEGKLSKWCDDNNFDYIISNHYTFSEPNVKNLFLSVKRVIRMIIRNSQAKKRIKTSVDLRAFDIIHTNSNRDNLGAILAKKHNIPHVWHLREYGKEDYDVRFYLPFSKQFMNSHTDKFIAISKGVESAWLMRGINKKKITQIYNGVNCSEIKRKLVYKEKSEKLKIVFTGSIVPSKGHFDIVNALLNYNDLLHEKFIVDFFYDGFDEEYLLQLKDIVSQKDAMDCIRFCGENNHIFQTLCHYDIGITCSKSEAFGRVTVEYMAAGLITIASNTGANPEIIDDGKNGFLYEYGNPESLSKILEKVYYMDEKEKRKIGQDAIERVEKNFTDEINAKNVYDLYLEILNRQTEK